MTYLIIDDEPIAHDIIAGYALKLPFMQLRGRCYDAFQAMDALAQAPVDLIFLDIEMPKLGGFDFLRALPRPPRVIVVSAHREYALEGYDLDVVDYLLKPFGFSRFLRAVQKARGMMHEEGREGDGGIDAPPTILIKDEKAQCPVRLGDILFIEACGNYCAVHQMGGEAIITQENLTDLASRLPSPAFVRVHRSYVVACAQVERFTARALVVAGREIPIGRTFKAAAHQALAAKQGPTETT